MTVHMLRVRNFKCMAMSGSAYSRFIHVPARSRRIEGDFPVMVNKINRREIVDLAEVDATDVDPQPFVDRSRGRSRAKPQRQSKSAKAAGSTQSGDLVKTFDNSQDLPKSTIDELKLKKFRWLPNPFLSEEDNRQGGPLYYAKYFRDRDRRLDDKVIREEVEKQQDLLASSKLSDSTPSKRQSKRKKAVWKNYRPLTESQISAIDSVDKLAKILANEIHLVNQGVLERSVIISAIEKRFDEIILDVEPSKKNTVNIVKVVYQFGIYQEMDPIILSRALDIITGPILRKLKPDNLVYLLEALCRLRFRDQRALKVLDALSLCWPLVLKSSPSLLVRGANAVARLDLSSAPSSAGLSSSLGEALPKMGRKNLEKLKAVTVTNPFLFHEIMLLDYFVLAHRENVDYVRHVLLAFLKVRSSNPDLVAKLPVTTKDWLEAIASKETNRKQLDSDESNEPIFSSDLHREISAVLGDECVVGTTCGPFTFDILIPNQNVVVDACSEFQFYRRTAKFTADARLRHDLIRQLGFKLVPVSHFQWFSLKHDSEKKEWLRKQIESSC